MTSIDNPSQRVIVASEGKPLSGILQNGFSNQYSAQSRVSFDVRAKDKIYNHKRYKEYIDKRSLE